MKRIYIITFTLLLTFYFTSSLKAQWTQTNTNGGGGAFCLTVKDSSIYAGCPGGNIYLTTDNGANWTDVNNGIPNNYVLSLKIIGTNMFAGTNITGVFLSTNNGANWTAINNGLTATPVVNSFANIGTYLFAGTPGDGVYRTTNNGQNWLSVNNGLNTTLIINTLAVKGTNIFAGTVLGVFRSSDNGANWIDVNNGIPINSVRTLAVIDSNLFAGYGNGTWGGIYLSSDNGSSWQSASSGMNNTNVGCIAGTGSNLFAGTPIYGVFYSSDNGANWTAINTGMTSLNTMSIVIKGNYVFKGGLGYVWRRPLSEILTSSEQISGELPDRFELKQNYPNPFNPSTTIRYTLPKSSYVSLRIYDILGREVKTLFSGYRNAGNYSDIFDATNFSSGVYYYSISSDKFNETKSMVLIK